MASPNITDTFSEQSLQEGIITQIEGLTLTEDKIKSVIGRRIEDGIRFWDQELELKTKRENNEKRWLNKNFEVSGAVNLYGFETDYRDNRIFISVETLASNTAARIPQPEVIEAQDTDASRELASDYSKVLTRKAQELLIKQKLQMVARHLLMGYRLGIMKVSWDASKGRILEDGTTTGDICVNFVRPHKIVLDARAEDSNDVPLIAEMCTKSVEELGFMFPKKKDKLMEAIGKTGDSKMMGSPLNYYEVWFSFFDKDGIKREGLCWKYFDVVLDYGLNPNFNYEDEPNTSNFFDRPKKPYILFNFLNIGKYALDDTSLTEQAACQQDILEKRGRQIVFNADAANSTKVFNVQMIEAGDAQKYTGDPNLNILSKGDVRAAFARVAPPPLPAYVFQDKLDARAEIDNIFGTHAPLRGEKTEAPTLGQEVMSQRSDLGRTITLSESLETGAEKVYQYMTQIYKVFATKEHIVKYIGEETGATTFINFSKDKIEDGVEIFVQHGSMSPQDKLTDRNEAVELAKIGGRIDPLSFAEKWHIDKPREFAKRLFYFLFMPDKYASEILKIGESGGDQDAMQTIQQINAGENVPPKENPSKEYLAYMNQFVRSPAFKQLNPEAQALMVEHLRGTLQSAKGGLKMGESNKSQSLGQKFTGMFKR